MYNRCSMNGSAYIQTLHHNNHHKYNRPMIHYGDLEQSLPEHRLVIDRRRGLFTRTKQSAMSVRFSSDGRRLLALRRRMPPVLYDTGSPRVLAQFDDLGYFNSCTMKSCCFAGESDQVSLPFLTSLSSFSLIFSKIHLCISVMHLLSHFLLGVHFS